MTLFVWNVGPGPVTSIYIHYVCFAVTKTPDLGNLREEALVLDHSSLDTCDHRLGQKILVAGACCGETLVLHS